MGGHVRFWVEYSHFYVAGGGGGLYGNYNYRGYIRCRLIWSDLVHMGPGRL